MSTPRTLILRTAGTNCDRETAFAFERAGAVAERVHVNRVLANPAMLKDYQILAIPGGFSYGDDIAAGKIMANQLMHHLGEALAAFVGAGKPVIGICNGFQVLVKTNLLPGPVARRSGQVCTLAHNDSGQFVDKWVRLTPPPGKQSRCIWTGDLQPLDLPIAHGEGKFFCADDTARKALWDNGQIALQYADAAGNPATDEASGNPNGSVDAIAGICDATGLVFGLMPHPERFIDPTQHPAWTRQSDAGAAGAGLQIFKKAVAHVR